MQPPTLSNKDYDARAVFIAENLLRAARHQKSISEIDIPAVCILDPDGDIVSHLLASGRATVHPH